MLSRLSALAERRAHRILLIAALSTIAAGALGLDVAGHLGPAGFVDPETQSAQANRELLRVGAVGPDLVVRVEAVRRGETALRERVARVTRLVRDEPLVARITRARIRDRSRAGGGPRVAAEYVRAVLRPAPAHAHQRAVQRVKRSLHPRLGILVGGTALVDPQLTEAIEHDFTRSELVAFPILFLLSLVFFRGFAAALLPPLLGAMAILGTMLVLRVLASWTEISVLTLNLITALGLGLAVDYSLFMVTRYREELARHGPTPAALLATMATAGRTVLFSSLTIAAIMASLLVFPQSVLYSMGLGGLIVALVSAVVSLVVLPAILATLGERVNALSPRRLRRRAVREARPLTSGPWYRLATFVARHAGTIAITVAALLLALAVPALRATFVPIDPSTLPADATARQVFEASNADGSLRRASGLRILVHDAGPREVRQLSGRLRRMPGVGYVGPARALPGNAFVLGVQPRSDVYAPASQQLVRQIRTTILAPNLRVTGPTAEFVDLQASLKAHLPVALLLIVGGTMLAVFLMTGSLVMGAKVLLMNTLTLGAVCGGVVVVFQDGRLESLLGYTSSGALDATAPVLLFAGVFALATDYGIFLLARIKEAVDAGIPNGDAVAIGQERTGRVITCAAALFCVSVGALVSSRIVPVQEVALGFALAVAIDATLVRALLMPALMHLLGRWNWWAPPVLRRLRHRIGMPDSDRCGGPPVSRQRDARDAGVTATWPV